MERTVGKVYLLNWEICIFGVSLYTVYIYIYIYIYVCIC